MALKRLPSDVQSLLCASAQVNSYKRAIEELIYNSLDAKSTSIAIRIDIHESTIQVVDNGYGVTKDDFQVIGQRYMTSKLTDVAALKAAPENYGYRGEFLANIITVSQIVKITSRHNNAEETWAKTFVNGKEKKFAQMTTRPTKGTTVDIKGFLYNLNIQKRGIDSVNELQNIKLFLEQLSLVHNHISLSLRDDSQNEIFFKIHKKRDIYQTLLTVFNIDKVDVQELQVEKHEYKVKGLIGKTYKDLNIHWIYLNGKCIHSSSKLHKVLNEYFKKSIHIKDQRRIKSKVKKNNDEHPLFNQNIPFYFIFVTCPYIHYDIGYTPKQSGVQFKNWEQINKLLEKLVKFYAGDVNLKEIKRAEDKLLNKEQINTKFNQDTRDEVKKIMDKILGSNSKKLGVSQLQNGIKGRIIKRKGKKKTNRSAVVPKCFLENDYKNDSNDNASTKNKTEFNPKHNTEHHIDQQQVDDSDKQKEHETLTNNRHCNIKLKTKKKSNISNKKELKANILATTKKRHKTTTKQKRTLNKQKNEKVNNKEFKYFKSTDSVCKRSNMVAQKVEDFLLNRILSKRNKMNQLENANRKIKKSTILPILSRENRASYNNIPLAPRTNKDIIEKYIMKKIKSRPYKTTYDLVQTVLKTQQEPSENDLSKELYNKFHKRNDALPCKSKDPKRFAWTHEYVCNEYLDISGKKEISEYTAHIPVQNKTNEYEENFSDYFSLYGQHEISQKTTNLYEHTQRETSHHTLSGQLTVLTYDSHQHHKNEVLMRNDTENCYTINKKQHVRFITKKSRDNFVTSNDFKNRFKNSFKSVSSNQTNGFDICMKQTIDESYTIEYSKSNENNYNTADIYNNTQQQRHNNNVNFNKENNSYKHATENYELVSPSRYINPILETTYSVHPSNFSLDNDVATENQIGRRENIQSIGLLDTYSAHKSHSEVNDDNNGSKTKTDDNAHNSKNVNTMFVSKSQQCSGTIALDNNSPVEPLNVCETVFYEMGSDEKEFAVSFNEKDLLNDSLYGSIKDGIDEHAVNGHNIITQSNSNTENVSHHLSCTAKTIQPNLLKPIIDDNLKDPIERNQNEIINKPEDLPDRNTEAKLDVEHKDCNFEINFNLKNRHRFVPKGMSQIFENCRTKTACKKTDYVDKDYFEDSIYNNFANLVQVYSEIYEPIIQNVEDLTTRNIHKFQNKVKKDNASLVFDETSLKNAKVLGQADCKFIVAIMKKRCSQTKEASDYLILFDQHAVDERIRLEKNLAGYLNEEIWTSVVVDNIILKMSKDEILYLHNYKDKFTQLGLQWTILNSNEVTVHSIPEAILGKNPREVEKVIRAVRNLITEEINIMKLQKGCVSLYPKSIMDLVFSESCRYAIKFGDHLSKSNCVELIDALSYCKTPFQCAHGRPVMAVIMDIVADKREYKINMEALRRFRQRNRRNLIK